MYTMTQQTEITCRKDIDDVITGIEYFADWHTERARLNVSLDISAVFTVEEEAAELRSAAATLGDLVIMPSDLYEEVWSLLDVLEGLEEEKKLPEALQVSGSPDHYHELLDQLRQYAIT